MRKGWFITFEGPDGTGKSTQIELLAAYFRNPGREVVVTREPGGTPLGEHIRRLLLDSSTKTVDPRAEMALMFAARGQHIREVIAPAVAAGTIVLCDRFTDSTEAYQGYGRGLGSEPVLAMHRLVCGTLQPDLTLLLMIENERESLARAEQRNQTAAADESRFEAEGPAFQRRVAEGYRSIAAREPERLMLVDASGTVAEVHARVVERVEAKIGRLIS